jgi:cellulose synthase/poly-beta-1,6-N-acetylglucosamine synthase-like glycosyltransferase
MSIGTPIARAWASPVTDTWAQRLVTAHDITPRTLKSARVSARLHGKPLAEVLPIAHDVSRLSISKAVGAQYHAQVVDPRQDPPDTALIATWGAHHCIRDGLLPWRRVGACTVILTYRTAYFAAKRSALEAQFGPVRMAITTEHQLNTAVSDRFSQQLVSRAENRVPDHVSSRTWNTRNACLYGLSVLITLYVAFMLSPTVTLGVLTGIALMTLLGQTVMKLIAIAFAFRRHNVTHDPHPTQPLPTITVLVPLYKEKEIADHLLKRLRAIEYPREDLDVCLIIEADDATTRAALGVTNLPTWMRVISVPKGTLKTKPRAMNYALDFAHGEIIGIYDAEDAPASDQLYRVAKRFANRGPEVACLQGVLDYYNAPVNWLTRCFALEYASWFRVILPGYAKLGMVVPLGGTTLFFRRDVLENLGAWDAHNVTEDADLGVRLARNGYVTELINTTTEEEANGRIWPWIKQRSRWLKGYAVTYGVHMRDPGKLLKDLGLWRFLAFQLQFGGTLINFVLAPLLLSFWIMPFGFPHPLAALFSGAVLYTVMAIFITSELANIAAATLGACKAGKPWLAKWAVTLHLYFPLAALAAYKGLYELAWKPFYWDKTTHGVLMGKTKI